MEQEHELNDVEMPLIENSPAPDCDETNVQVYNSDNLQSSEPRDNTYGNQGANFTTGIDIFSKEEKLRMEERAKRFGLTDKLKNSLSDKEHDLYASMGVAEENENTKNIRLNVIHMRGTEEMSTKDVFKYFEDYAPASIEWINDVSCNVVWLDNVSAARAMLGLSKRIVGLNTLSRNDRNVKRDADRTDEENDSTNVDSCMEIDEENASVEPIIKNTENSEIHIKDISYPLPPGIWRKGIDYPKSKGIFLRFASRADKKQPRAERLSEYYKKYGNPNFGGIKGILTESRKRMYKQIGQNKRKQSEDTLDDSNDTKRVKNPWGALSETWGVNDFVEDGFVQKIDHKDQGRSVKDRLGLRVQLKDNADVDAGAHAHEHADAEVRAESESSSDSEEDWCTRSKVLRMRMHADDEEEKMHKRQAKLRSKMTSNSLRGGGDLRSRLGGKPQNSAQFRNAIKVIVTNASLPKSNSSTLDNTKEEEGEIVENAQAEEEEKEEGEWLGTSDEERNEEEQPEEDGKGKEYESDEGSDEPAKEVQGPRGSVVKVVQNKPRLASTVWARLNRVKSEINTNAPKERKSKARDLRDTLKSNDLRSRIGSHARGRSPLRIEVKNDKYTENESGTE